MKILVTPVSLCKNKDSEAIKILKEFADEIVFNPYERALKEDEIIPLLDNVDGYIAGVDFISAKVIEAAPPTLKVISRYGVGIERVDIVAAGKKGIVVTNTPGVYADSVAEMTIGLMLAVCRKIPYLNNETKKGNWPKELGIELSGKTLGIIGLGSIGKRVAIRAKAFSMKVIAYDLFFDEKFLKKYQIEKCSFEELIKKADIITLHLPLTDKTYHIIDKKAIEKMKNGVILINTSRGGLIDEKALFGALKSGKIGGVGLDVFENEPPGILPLFEFENVIVTPHTSSHTKEVVEKMGIMAVRNLIDVLTKNECNFIVNREYLGALG